jgi:hypothetical protein
MCDSECNNFYSELCLTADTYPPALDFYSTERAGKSARLTPFLITPCLMALCTYTGYILFMILIEYLYRILRFIL